MKKIPPQISACIPVFQTEEYLEQCLTSVFLQDFDNFEIIVVSDNSKSPIKLRAKKIVLRTARKMNSERKKRGQKAVPTFFYEHSENRGILEVRRTLVSLAKGEYVCFVDSDDCLEAGALRSLFEAAVSERDSENPDIIQGRSLSGVFGDDGAFTLTESNKYGNVQIGSMRGRGIFESWIFEKGVSGILWAKLIKTSLLQKAYENFPYTECNMADDFLISFFLMKDARTYVGIESKVYRYRITSGMSSHRKIDSMQRWRLICSSASVFTVLSEWIKESPGALTTEEIDKVREKTRFYLANNLRQLNETVTPELREEAHKMLCEYWGKSFVEKAEKAMEESKLQKSIH